VIEEAPPAAPQGPVRWTWRAYLLLGVGAVLATLAVASRDPVPLFAAIPLLVAPFLAGSQVARQLAPVDLTWQASGLGPDVTIAGELRGRFGGDAVDIAFELPRPFGAVEVAPPQFERQPDRIRFRFCWRLSEPSIVIVPAPPVVWRDPIGLTERVLEGRRPSLAVERYPPSLHRLGSMRLERTTTLPGEVHSRVLGASGEFYGLREPAPGDPPRTINWRASARAGRPLANDYRLDRTGDLLVVLDVRPTSLGPDADERLLGIARAAVHGIAETFLQNKTRIGFASFGEFLTAVPLSTGRIHRVRILRAIAAARREEIAGPAMRCALGLRRFYPRGVTTLVVSTWTEDPSFNLVPYIQRQGFPVVLLSPSPLPMRRNTGGLEPADEPLAERLEKLERRVRLSELWVHGPVVDWDDFWTLEPLARTLRRPARRRIS
jgi:uncharacterized protein (DUF58 family)